MTSRSTLLKAVLRERHWQTHATFTREYDKAARSLDPTLAGSAPSRAQLTRWLAGDLCGLPRPDHCRVLEAMFPGVTVQQLFAPLSTALRRQPPSCEEEIDRRAAGLGPLPLPTAPGADVSFNDGHGWGPLAPEASLGEEIMMATEESARFVRRARGTVDGDVLDQLAADVRKLAVSYLSKPPYAMMRQLATLRTEVFEMLEAPQRPKVLPALYRIGGQLCALLAHACADLGHAYAAETDTRAAWLCADLAEDNDLRAFVRWVQSNVAYWDGDLRRAAELAHGGQRFATTGTGLLRLASQEARAYAAAGERREVERALATALAARDDAEFAEDVGVFNFEPGKAAYYASEVRLSLGGKDNCRQAAADAQEALDLFALASGSEYSPPELVAAARLDLCSARLVLEDLDGVEEHLRPVLSLPSESRTIPLVKRIRNTDKLIANPKYQGASLTNDLREQIALFCAYTAFRELPSELAQ